MSNNGPPRRYMNQRRSSFDRVNIKHVPPSRHAIFFRGLPQDVDVKKIRDYFEKETQSNVGIDFHKVNEQKKMCIALRFESHDIAREMLNKYNQVDLIGNRVEVSWFKDLKKAKDRMMDEQRNYDDRPRGRYEYDGDRRNARMNSVDNRRGSSIRNRSPSKSSNKSERSESRSESESIKENELIKTGTYDDVDLDDEDGVVYTPKLNKENEEINKHSKHDGDDKKKKKKKRKKRRQEHSESVDSGEPPEKVNKVEVPIENGNPKFSAIAGDMNNWKETRSDSDDYLEKPSEIVKSKSFIQLSSDKLNSDKNVKLLKMKVADIEKAFKHDCETFSQVTNVFIRKAPELKMRLESILKDVLVDLGDACMENMREYVVELTENIGNVSKAIDGSQSSHSSH